MGQGKFITSLRAVLALTLKAAQCTHRSVVLSSQRVRCEPKGRRMVSHSFRRHL